MEKPLPHTIDHGVIVGHLLPLSRAVVIDDVLSIQHAVAHLEILQILRSQLWLLVLHGHSLGSGLGGRPYHRTFLLVLRVPLIVRAILENARMAAVHDVDRRGQGNARPLRRGGGAGFSQTVLQNVDVLRLLVDFAAERRARREVV